MAIDADIIGSNGAELTLPPVFVKRAAAAGFVDLDVDVESVTVNNLTTSQLIYVRLNDDADSTVAGSADSKSVRVEAGQSLTFKVGALDGSTTKLSIA